MRNQLLIAAVLGSAVLAGEVGAQQHAPGSFSVEPYVGVFHDTYDIGADGSTGTLAGLRLAYALNDRTRLLANVGGGKSSDVASRPTQVEDYWVYGNRWLMTTAGAEYDVHQGRTAVALGLQAGAGWRKVMTEDQVGAPLDAGRYAGDGYAFYDVVVPSLSLRHALTPHATVVLGVSDYVFDVLEWDPAHAPALSLGVSLN